MNNIELLFQEFNWTIAFGIMIGYMIIDGIYVKYTLELVALKPLLTANLSVVMYILSAFAIINYTENWLYAIPMIIGAWLGTYFVIRYEKNKKKLPNPKSLC
jgi:hypothetical protein